MERCFVLTMFVSLYGTAPRYSILEPPPPPKSLQPYARAASHYSRLAPIAAVPCEKSDGWCWHPALSGWVYLNFMRGEGLGYFPPGVVLLCIGN